MTPECVHSWEKVHNWWFYSPMVPRLASYLSSSYASRKPQTVFVVKSTTTRSLGNRRLLSLWRLTHSTHHAQFSVKKGNLQIRVRLKFNETCVSSLRWKKRVSAHVCIPFKSSRKEMKWRLAFLKNKLSRIINNELSPWFTNFIGKCEQLSSVMSSSLQLEVDIQTSFFVAQLISRVIHLSPWAQETHVVEP